MNLEKQIKNLPKEPGVYIFRGTRNQVIYVGKAANLRQRVRSYFQKNIHLRTIKLTREIKSLEVQPAQSAIEALIIEAQLIKKHHPKFNVLLRDDKNYSFVGITRLHRGSGGQAKENFPRIFITHQPLKENSKFLPCRQAGKIQNSKVDYIGPFTDAGALRAVMRLVRHYFPYCTCKKPHRRICINYQIRKCLGVCCMTDKKGIPHTQGDYLRNVKAIKKILKGQNKRLIRDLKQKLGKLIKNEEFEKAAKIRDMILGVENIMAHKLVQKAHLPRMLENQNITLKLLREFIKMENLPARIEAYDISNIQGKEATGSMIVFMNGKIAARQYRKFKIRTKKTPDDIAMLKEVLNRRFKHKGWSHPDLIFIDGGRAQINAAIKVFKELKIKIPTFSLGKGKGEVFASTRNAAVRLEKLPRELKLFIIRIKDQAHKFAIKYHRLIRTKAMIAHET